MNTEYLQTARLLLDIAPVIFEEPAFALKGGTALNLFIQDLPRLSVDIDVAFVPHQMERKEALGHIEKALLRAKARLTAQGYRVESAKVGQAEEVKLFVSDDETMVKIEVNYVFRGTIAPPVKRMLSPKTQALFTTAIELPLLSTAELYGGKMVAALDRQHPRDWFDVWKMHEAFGLPEDFVQAFVIYLAGHNRPIHEVLFGTPKELKNIFYAEFEGMTNDRAPLERLEETRTWLFKTLPKSLTDAHKEFLLSMANCQPRWDLMNVGHLADMPGIRWKLLNLLTLQQKNPVKLKEHHQLLADKFNQM